MLNPFIFFQSAYIQKIGLMLALRGYISKSFEIQTVWYDR